RRHTRLVSDWSSDVCSSDLLADGSLVDRFRECKDAGLPGIPAAELLHYFTEAAEALDFLRKEKMAHRDIKPANLLHVKGHAKVRSEERRVGKESRSRRSR